jgi:hypothetical protein
MAGGGLCFTSKVVRVDLPTILATFARLSPWGEQIEDLLLLVQTQTPPLCQASS